MSKNIRNKTQILKKIGIQQLNEMQQEAALAIDNSNEVLVLSPTGTGKTLAFLLPILEQLDPTSDCVQVVIIVPSRELAIQIDRVWRAMGSGYKSNAVYGGRNFSKDKIELKHAPAVLIGTPGRVSDHLFRNTIATTNIRTLILDEFDKSLEIGFETEMKTIVRSLATVKQKILTSATHNAEIPSFVGIKEPLLVDFLSGKEEGNLEMKTVLSPSKDKVETLLQLLSNIGNKPGIIFCNYKDSIQRVSNYLTDNNVSHACFFGGMEQQDRERALLKFRNGTHQLLLATDLAARGIDIPDLGFIIHYHLPIKEQEFTHRNGRTARMHKGGIAYVLKWEKEKLPDFIPDLPSETLEDLPVPEASAWQTLFISGGRKDKISKGDVAGLLIKQGGLKGDEVGVIELKQDCAFVAVKTNELSRLVDQLNNTRLKKKKVRIKEV